MIPSVSTFNPLCFFFQTQKHFKVVTKLFTTRNFEDNEYSECGTQSSCLIDPMMMYERICRKKLTALASLVPTLQLKYNLVITSSQSDAIH